MDRAWQSMAYCPHRSNHVSLDHPHIALFPLSVLLSETKVVSMHARRSTTGASASGRRATMMMRSAVAAPCTTFRRAGFRCAAAPSSFT
eukprot:363378-Chlamydomonas_euryale.AAC.41